MKDLPKYTSLSLLDCEVSAVFERRNLLTGMLDNYEHPIEIVISFPASMGERGVQNSLFYDEYPSDYELYKDTKKELREYIKSDHFLVAGLYAPSYNDEKRIRTIRKALKAPLTPTEEAPAENATVAAPEEPKPEEANA